MHRTAFLMMLYMGFRITETYAIKWDDVDLENELLVQRDTKNGTDHELPIPTLLVPEIEELMLLTGGSCYMFPAVRRDTFHGRPKRQIKQINDAVSFDFNPHMTRHTFTTIAEAVGISKTMIDRLTNHTTTNDVTGGYIHTEIETLRDAINKITAYIQAKTTDSGKVVQLYG
jgi:integrase